MNYRCQEQENRQKRGLRRYQDKNGSLTSVGKAHALALGSSLAFGSDPTYAAMADAAKKVNGGKRAFEYIQNRNRNCAYCTTAYELRRRGLDVMAKPNGRGVALAKDPNMAFEGAVVQDQIKHANSSMGTTKKEYDQMASAIVASQGEGARGNIFGQYKSEVPKVFNPNNIDTKSGHSMAYEVHNGKLTIIDGQVGKVYANGHDAVKHFTNVSTIRTDNLKINESAKNKIVQDASVKKHEPLRTAKIVAETAGVASVASVAGLEFLVHNPVALSLAVSTVGVAPILTAAALVDAYAFPTSVLSAIVLRKEASHPYKDKE